MKVKSVAERSMFATSLDLSDAYHHIPVRKDSHVYMCFQVKDKRYIYLVLSFGLMTAPWAFTQVVKQVKVWSSRHHPGTVSISGRLAKSLQVTSARKGVDGTLSDTLRGIRIIGKSGKVGAPTYAIDCLPRRETRPGPRPDLFDERTPSSRHSSSGTSDSAAQSQDCSGGFIAGAMSEATPTVPLGRMHMRLFQLDVIRQVRAERNGNAWVPVIGQSAKALGWWTHVPHWQIGVPFQIAPPQEIVFTDVSTMEWGVAF